MNKNIFKISVASLAGIFILSGCQLIQPVQQASDYISGKVQLEQKKQADKTLAIFKCQELCQETLAVGNVDLDIGLCLSEEIISDWVCDIAHSPRQPIDNDPRNQCASFRSGQTHHFVELDGNCNVIEVY